MSGFVGMVDPTGAAIDPIVLRQMNLVVARRGPDAEGLWTAPGVGLGHQRLVVMDPSDAGAQPMGSDDGAVQLVFDGEIYNFLDLRSELQGLGHHFRSLCDTEVLLRAYLQWGQEVVQHIDGMFAFAVWDGRTKRLFAARDRLGKKPLYFAQVDRPGRLPPLFAFASELKALLHVPYFNRTVCVRALQQYLAFAFVPAPLSIFAGARKLAAAQCLSVNLSPLLPVSLRMWRYWALPLIHDDPTLHPEAAAEILWTMLTRAVERRLVSDVPLGVFLSGGLASSAVAAAMHALLGGGRGIHTFSLVLADSSGDQSNHAGMVADFLECTHHEEVVDTTCLLAAWHEVGRIFDEPLADAALVPTYLLSKFARQDVQVALSGDGIDALFDVGATPASSRWRRMFLRPRGMVRPWRHPRFVSSFPSEELPILNADFLASAQEDPGSPLDAQARETKAPRAKNDLADNDARSPLATAVGARVDGCGGAVGLQMRLPFCDTDLVTFAHQLSLGSRSRGSVCKFVLERALKGRLPPQTPARKKQGLCVPVGTWLKGPLQGLLQDELQSEKLHREGFFDPQVVQTAIAEHTRGQSDRQKVLWTLLSFERWYSEYGRP